LEEGGSEVTFQGRLRSGGSEGPIEKIGFGVNRRAWEHFKKVATQLDGRVLYGPSVVNEQEWALGGLVNRS
jgi:hypothetical protein